MVNIVLNIVSSTSMTEFRLLLNIWLIKTK